MVSPLTLLLLLALLTGIRVILTVSGWVTRVISILVWLALVVMLMVSLAN
ncbi:hypothetical protein HOE425_330710 [Hoeflea sp. EC-HK425]|nr:hypothetical protein HOE425_330710 [Hoeflea sp. EC-HK425]